MFGGEAYKPLRSGVASRDDILEAYRLAVKVDPVSAFGGIVAFNVEVDEVNQCSSHVMLQCFCDGEVLHINYLASLRSL